MTLTTPVPALPVPMNDLSLEGFMTCFAVGFDNLLNEIQVTLFFASIVCHLRTDSNVCCFECVFGGPPILTISRWW